MSNDTKKPGDVTFKFCLPALIEKEKNQKIWQHKAYILTEHHLVEVQKQ